MKKCYAMIHVSLHDMDHNIDLNYRRKIRPVCTVKIIFTNIVKQEQYRNVLV